MESDIFSVKTLLGFRFEFYIADASHNHAFFKKSLLEKKISFHYTKRACISLQGVNVTQSAKEVFCKSRELLLESVYLSDS